MAQATTRVTDRPEWKALAQHKRSLENTHLRELFSQDNDRFSRFFVEGAGLSLDFSRNRMTEETLAMLTALAEACGLHDKTEAMFTGERINVTEQRPVLHTALRYSGNDPVLVDGVDVMPEVRATLARMEHFIWRVRNGHLRGFSGKRFTDVVSIGIGGSYLGPKLVAEGLKPYWLPGLGVHYVANIDGTDVSEKLRGLDPDTTLFLIQSKSFGTQETLENSRVARDWFFSGGGTKDTIGQHFVAVTANTEVAVKFGIAEENIFPMWDWVGGRYSLWSAIGLPLALAIGMDNFRRLLNGAEAMDQHFRSADPAKNLPVITAMLGVWYTNFWNAESHAVLAYDQYLRGLPAHLQQLDMESSGKSVMENGEPVSWHTGPIIWGGPGANGQHAYHQLLHQGTRLVPADFIMPLRSHNPVADHHATLFANGLSQSRALMEGKTLEQAKEELVSAGVTEPDLETLARHKVIEGNKPSNTILMERVTPETLGALVALYEHRTFVQGIIWGIDSFDQWGVELGKQSGKTILPLLLGQKDEELATQDSSTRGLIEQFRLRGRD